MKKCLLGCGLVIHDVDEHLKTAHPDVTEEQYPPDPPYEMSKAGYSAYYDALKTRADFIGDNFSKVTL